MRVGFQLISTTKFLINFFFFRSVDLFVLPSNKLRPKSLLLVRLDAIGDYILFRNFIKDLRSSSKYKEFEITFLGNIAYKSLSLELDGEYIDRFIWIDKGKFLKNLNYRLNKLKEISDVRYETVVHPVYSREFFTGDSIVKLINANEKIGSIGDLSNTMKWQKNISDKYYGTLIPAQDKLMFEFDRNREFFEKLLDIKIYLQKPIIHLQNTIFNFKLPKNYAIIFIGASASFRKWNINNFVKIAEYLKESHEYNIVLCGGPADIGEAKEFKKYYKDEYLDLVGKTSLVELLIVINSGNIMIANETSAPHFAMALGIKNLFVIYSGNHYGRFTPYPKDVSKNYHVICHPTIEKDLDGYKKLSNSYGFRSSLNINEISVEGVKDKINEVLKC